MSSNNENAEKNSRKKENKRKRKENDIDSSIDGKLKKERREERKEKKKAEKEELLSKVPKVDEHGIAYTKVQIKRMMKRVKRGLPPVPSEEEERERIKKLKEEERETQEELSGMIFNRSTEDGDHEMNDAGESHGGSNGSDQEDEDDDQDDDAAEYEHPRKKKTRSKPVPEDYVCCACNNKNSPLHWIYDCPDKIHKPGSNNIKKKLKGVNEPSSRKVFVSGLPFDVKAKDVEAYFEKEQKCGKVLNCKLLLFSDTKRCKGTGFVTFETDEGAKRALRLDGTVFDIKDADDDKANSKQSMKHKLRLGVKKVLSRSVTKK